jgi:MoaA/NifB/PqqE/SkfB family radical SAM enzyme
MSQNNFIKICHWEITKRCNLSCIHCISNTGKKQEFDTIKALKTINILNNLGCKELYITGGEPLIRKDIFKILEKAKKYKFKIGLLTNGTLINKINIKKIKKNIDEIGMSLDGSCSQINDKIRGDKSFQKTVKAIRLVKQNKIPITLYITINKINIYDFGNILKLAIKLGINNIRINEISLRGKAFKNKQNLNINKEQINLKEYLLETLVKHFKQKKESVSVSNNCDVDPKTIFISPTGYIYPCIEIFQKNQRKHSGNVLNYDHDKFEKYIKYFRETHIKKTKCPYQFIILNKSAICLNKPNGKCSYI